ncbi:MAG: GDP-L-fucose synthase [Flavobacteriaceae bacterium]|nr:GDP-L-fucose synthase [Flavobacteriaceae bacterium]
MNKNIKIYIAGHNGMVGRAIWRQLVQNGYTNLIGKPSTVLDLRNQAAVNQFLKESKIEVVIDAAARVGGILANKTYPYQFIMENMLIQNNLINGAFKVGIKKFIFLGSSCIYPKLAEQPIREEALLTGQLESTNEWYAIAKISGVKACEAIRNQYGLDYVSLMPTNLYGIHDNFDLNTSHVLPAMIRKFHEAKENRESVELWGTGTPLREFLFVDDLAEAVCFAFENKLSDYLYNVGCGEDLTIKELATKIQKVVGHKGDIKWDDSKPNGTPRKWLNVSKLKKEGWQANTSLEAGLKLTYKWFLEHVDTIKEVKM